jgi:hypothetical protein
MTDIHIDANDPLVQLKSEYIVFVNRPFTVDI